MANKVLAWESTARNSSTRQTTQVHASAYGLQSCTAFPHTVARNSQDSVLRLFLWTSELAQNSNYTCNQPLIRQKSKSVHTQTILHNRSIKPCMACGDEARGSGEQSGQQNSCHRRPRMQSWRYWPALQYHQEWGRQWQGQSATSTTVGKFTSLLAFIFHLYMYTWMKQKPCQSCSSRTPTIWISSDWNAGALIKNSSTYRYLSACRLCPLRSDWPGTKVLQSVSGRRSALLKDMMESFLHVQPQMFAYGGESREEPQESFIWPCTSWPGSFCWPIQAATMLPTRIWQSTQGHTNQHYFSTISRKPTSNVKTYT